MEIMKGVKGLQEDEEDDEDDYVKKESSSHKGQLVSVASLSLSLSPSVVIWYRNLCCLYFLLVKKTVFFFFFLRRREIFR